MQNEFLNEIIGQSQVKERLQMYSESHNRGKHLPNLLFQAGQGSGKTKLTRDFNKTLVGSNGQEKPLLEVNCATISKVPHFWDAWYPSWKNTGATIFFDECHNLPPKLQEQFLTVFEKSPQTYRRLSYNHPEFGETEYTFDFTKMSAIFATTDHQKMLRPLVDRLTPISLQEYSDDELYEIFLLNKETKVDDAIRGHICSYFRGHPRSSVEMAEQIDLYCHSKKVEIVRKEHFEDFRRVMGIHPYGLNDNELQIIRVLAERGKCSLTALSAATGYSKSVIQKDYEFLPLKKGLMDIDGQRFLTPKGQQLSLTLINK